MELFTDFKELLELFNDQKIEYMIVGGYAVLHYGSVRNTGDIDLFVKPSPENASKILKVLSEFGFGGIGLNEQDFQKPDSVVQLGVPPIRIDIINTIDGVEWTEAIDSVETAEYSGIRLPFIGKQLLIKNKQASGRLKDLADIEKIS